MTNKEKFIEIFGEELPARKYGSKDWWDQEYESPALEQEPILDKIRAEIIDKYMTATGEVNTVAKGCLDIIDNYTAENEGYT